MASNNDLTASQQMEVNLATEMFLLEEDDDFEDSYVVTSQKEHLLSQLSQTKQQQRRDEQFSLDGAQQSSNKPGSSNNFTTTQHTHALVEKNQSSKRQKLMAVRKLYENEKEGNVEIANDGSNQKRNDNDDEREDGNNNMSQSYCEDKENRCQTQKDEIFNDTLASKVSLTPTHQESQQEFNVVVTQESSSPELIEIHHVKNDTFEEDELEILRRSPFAGRISPSSTEIEFQIVDIQYSITEYITPKMPGIPNNPNPIIRMFGVTKAGNSICCNIHGFLPYVYASMAYGFKPADVQLLLKKLNSLLQKKESRGVNEYRVLRPVLKIEICQKSSIVGFRNNHASVLRITFAYPMLVYKLKEVLESGKVKLDDARRGQVFVVYEANVSYLDRFMIDMKLGGCGWVKVKRGSYKLRNMELAENVVLDMTHEEIKPATLCQIEVDTYSGGIEPNPTNNEVSSCGLRILSFDIECAGRPGIFPQPEIDSIIQIAVVGAKVTQPREMTQPFLKAVLTLRSCAPIPGVIVKSFADERELLKCWHTLVLAIDPDIITGYNISGFDLNYVLQRAKKLDMKLQHQQQQQQQQLQVGRLGRIRSEQVQMRSKVGKYNTVKEYTLSGRIILDMFNVIRQDYSLPKYSLDAVSEHFLGDRKDDVPIPMITQLFNGNEMTRKRLAEYCLKDAILPVNLNQKLGTLINLIAKSRAANLPINGLLKRGPRVGVYFRALCKATELDFLVPLFQDHGKQVKEKLEKTYVRGEKELEWECSDLEVLPQTKEIYAQIILSNNLCFTTLVTSLEEVEQIGLANLNTSPTSTVHQPIHFVKPNVKRGLLPLLLEQLMSEGKEAKTDMKNETDPLKKELLQRKFRALRAIFTSVFSVTVPTRSGLFHCTRTNCAILAFEEKMKKETEKMDDDSDNKTNVPVCTNNNTNSPELIILE